MKELDDLKEVALDQVQLRFLYALNSLGSRMNTRVYISMLHSNAIDDLRERVKRLDDVADKLEARLTALEAGTTLPEVHCLKVESGVHGNMIDGLIEDHKRLCFRVLELEKNHFCSGETEGRVAVCFERIAEVKKWLEVLEKQQDHFDAHTHDDKGIVCWPDPAAPKPLPCCEGCADFPCVRVNKGGDGILVYEPEGPKAVCFNSSHICGECAHACELDSHATPKHADDILCLRATTWEHPRFEDPVSQACDFFEKREVAK